MDFKFGCTVLNSVYVTTQNILNKMIRFNGGYALEIDMNKVRVIHIHPHPSKKMNPSISINIHAKK